jgi:hypothetical protein
MLVELVVEGVLSVLFEGLCSGFGHIPRIPLRVWVPMGLVALGIVAMNMAFAAAEPTRSMLFALTGACVVLSPVALVLWPNSPRRPRPRRR